MSGAGAGAAAANGEGPLIRPPRLPRSLNSCRYSCCRGSHSVWARPRGSATLYERVGKTPGQCNPLSACGQDPGAVQPSISVWARPRGSATLYKRVGKTLGQCNPLSASGGGWPGRRWTQRPLVPEEGVPWPGTFCRGQCPRTGNVAGEGISAFRRSWLARVEQSFPERKRWPMSQGYGQRPRGRFRGFSHPGERQTGTHREGCSTPRASDGKTTVPRVHDSLPPWDAPPRGRGASSC